MRLDEEGIRLEADKFYRSLPEDTQAKIHSDDILALFRENRKYAMDRGKAVKTRTALIGAASIAGGYILGFGVGGNMYVPLIVGIIAGALGFTISERLGTAKVVREVTAHFEASLVDLFATRLKS